jgi:hypothetical protein
MDLEEGGETARSIARALTLLDVLGAAGLSLLLIGVGIVIGFVIIAVPALIQAARRKGPHEGSVMGLGDSLYFSVVFGMVMGSIGPLCGALVYLLGLVNGEFACSPRALRVVGVVLAIAGLTLGAGLRLGNFPSWSEWRASCLSRRGALHRRINPASPGDLDTLNRPGHS